MTTVLKVEASARQTRSLSRELARHFMESWKLEDKTLSIIERDVGLNPPGAISEAWIEAVFTPQEDRRPEQRDLLALSDTLIEEVKRSDVIVISTPMYNYAMPAALKAWFDQVIRVNETFSFDLGRGDRPLEPILSGKTLVILTSCGEFGFEQGGLNEEASHLVPHIVTVSKYLGVETWHHIGIEYQEFGDARHEKSKREAKEQACELAKFIARGVIEKAS